MDYPKSSVYSDVFPCGYVSEDGEVYTEFTVKELTGVEEDILASNMDEVEKMGQVIGNCLVNVKNENNVIDDHAQLIKISRQMPMADRLAAILATRIVSLGDKFSFKIQCASKSCNNVDQAYIMLSSLEKTQMKNPEKQIREDEFADGKTIEWHILRPQDMKWLEKARKKMKKKKDMTLMILSRVDKIDGVEIQRQGAKLKDSIRVLQSLSIGERNSIRNLFREKEGDIDLDINHECSVCGHEFTQRLELTEDFFFPSGE